MLTVKDVIEFLQALPPDMMVQVGGEQVKDMDFLALGLVLGDICDHLKKLHAQSERMEARINAAPQGTVAESVLDRADRLQWDIAIIEAVCDTWLSGHFEGGIDGYMSYRERGEGQRPT